LRENEGPNEDEVADEDAMLLSVADGFERERFCGGDVIQYNRAGITLLK